MFRVALWEPEIPANTGNIGRLCLGAGASLHLIGGIGFRLDDRTLRRAGVDYWSDVQVQRHPTLADFEDAFPEATFWCLSTKAKRVYTSARFQPGDVLLFGKESAGLPAEVIFRYGERALTIPMPGGNVRSLNLANAVAIVLYEALRQTQGW